MATGVQAGQGTVGRLITDTAWADEALMLLARASDAMSELQGGTARLPEITGAMADEARDLRCRVLQTQTSIHELERLIKAMQRHSLLRKYVNHTNPPPLQSLLAPVVPESKRVKALHSPRDSAK